MNQKQYNRDNIDKKLGAGLDIEQAWSEFENKEDKRRPVIFIWLGLITLIGISALYIKTSINRNDSTISKAQFENQTKNLKGITLPEYEDDKLTKYINKEAEVERNIQSLKLEVQSVFALDQEKVAKHDDKNRNSESINQSTLKTILLENQNVQLTPDTQYDSSSNTLQVVSALTEPSFSRRLKGSTMHGAFDGSFESSIEELNTIQNIHLPIANPVFINIAKLPTRENGLLVQQQKQLHYIPSIVFENTDSNKVKLYSVSTYSSVGFMQRSLDPYMDNLQLRRADNDKALYRYAFGTLVSRKFTNRINLSIGLEYSTHVSRLKDVIQKIGQANILENQIIAYRLKGVNSEAVYGNIMTTDIEIIEKSRYQYYRSIAIPMRISITQNLVKGLGLEAGVGISYHLYMSAVGKTYKEDGSVGSYQSLSNLPYKANNLIDFRIHAGIFKDISDRWSTGLSVVYNTDLNSRILPSSSFTDKFSALNLELCLTRHF